MVHSIIKGKDFNSIFYWRTQSFLRVDNKDILFNLIFAQELRRIFKKKKKKSISPILHVFLIGPCPSTKNSALGVMYEIHNLGNPFLSNHYCKLGWSGIGIKEILYDLYSAVKNKIFKEINRLCSFNVRTPPWRKFTFFLDSLQYTQFHIVWFVLKSRGEDL